MVDRDIIKDKYMSQIKEKWLQSKDTFPDFLNEISYKTKDSNETYINKMSEVFQKQFKTYPRMKARRKRWKYKTLDLFHDALNHETIIGVHNYMNEDSLLSMEEELKEFLRQCRKFAPELPFDSIGQGIRNYMVYTLFKDIHNITSEFSFSAFGYSMLYPITDNYIDNNQISDSDKCKYNELIRNKLLGSTVSPSNTQCQRTCDLLDYIEQDFPRENYKDIYCLLLMMLEAQEDSLKQQNTKISLSFDERLHISLYKGSISVLIDRFLVKKVVTDADLVFYLGFGFFLQLADDLQDMKEDSIHGNQTIFTYNTRCNEIEKLVNKMLHFLYQIYLSYPADNEKFKDFLLLNSFQLVFSSVIGSMEYFSNEYLNNVEKYLIVTFPFITNLKNSMKEKELGNNEKYIKLLDSLLEE